MKKQFAIQLIIIRINSFSQSTDSLKIATKNSTKQIV